VNPGLGNYGAADTRKRNRRRYPASSRSIRMLRACWADPRAGRVGGHPGEVKLASVVFDEFQDVQAGAVSRCPR